MKKIVLPLALLVVAGLANAQPVNVPSGLTGLWRFQTSANKLSATIGTDLVSVDEASTWFVGDKWTMIGVPGNAGLYGDNGVVQEQAYGYLQVNPGLTANGGGSYVNQYTVAVDYKQGSDTGDHYNSLFQTAWDGRDNDGDLWIAGGGADGSDWSQSTIGVGAAGYSTLTFDSMQWHRIVWSINNGNWFRVYVDGTLFLDGTPQAIDDTFALYPDRFNLFADNDWEDAWGLVGTAAVWDHALTGDEVAAMGSVDTTLIIPEPGAFSLIALGGLIGLIRRIRK